MATAVAGRHQRIGSCSKAAFLVIASTVLALRCWLRIGG